MRLTTAAVFCAVGAAAAGQVMAADVVGTTSAAFVNPMPATAVTTEVGTANFTFGAPNTTSDKPNRLTFTSTNFSSDFESPFKVGSLFYYNGTTTAASLTTSVDLSLSLNFSQPTIPAFTNSFTLNLVATPNSGDADANADYVFFPTAFSSSTFEVGGTTYRVQLTGFSNVVGDGFLASNSQQLHVRENSSATADLFAVVTTASPAPEPASWAMMVGGFGLLGTTLRRRKGNVSFA